MTPQQLLTQWKAGTFAPVYLLVGPEMYRRRVCRKMLLEKFLPEELREEGFSRHDLDEVDLRTVLDDASSFSLFASKRVIWASGAEAVLPRGNSPDAEAAAKTAIATYAGNPSPDVVVVFDSARITFDNEDKSKLERLRKVFGAVSNQVEFQRYSEDEAKRLAGDLAKSAGLKISPSVLESMVEALGNDAARISVELEKLALFTGGTRPVTEEDIAALSPDARSTTVFALVNALSRRDRPGSLDLMETLVREGEYLPLALTFLATQFRLALAAKEEGLKNTQQIMGHFSKLGVGMWPSRAQQVLLTVNAFTRTQMERALLGIYQADKSLRDRAPDDRIVMEKLVLSMTG